MHFDASETGGPAILRRGALKDLSKAFGKFWNAQTLAFVPLSCAYFKGKKGRASFGEVCGIETLP